MKVTHGGGVHEGVGTGLEELLQALGFTKAGRDVREGADALLVLFVEVWRRRGVEGWRRLRR